MTPKKKKTILLTDNNDPAVFQAYGKYQIFDKNIVIEQNVNEFVNDTKIENYIKNNIIARELETQLKNKKMDCLVYLLQGSDMEKVKTGLEAMVAKIKNNTVFTIVCINPS